MRFLTYEFSRCVLIGTLVVSWALVTAAGAATRRHDVADQLYLNHAAEPQFAAAGYSTLEGLQWGSWVLIDPHWALTAAHVLDQNDNGSVADETLSNHAFVLGSESRTPSLFHIDEQWNGNIYNGCDIGLAYFNQPFLLTQPANIYTGNSELDHLVSTVGFGRTGTGKTGAFQDDALKRAFDNRIDFYARFPGTDTFFVSRTDSAVRTGLYWDFDEPEPRTSPDFNPLNNVPPAPLRDLEGNGAPGDSGGPSFIFENNQWWVVGISSAQNNAYQYPNATDPENIGTYGDGTLVTRVSSYDDWIYYRIDSFAVGDFNFDGPVDAADYVVWRNNLGDSSLYNVWRTYFGTTPGSGSRGERATSAVPEPTSSVVLMFKLLAIFVGCRDLGLEARAARICG
jgi:Trypsin